MPVQTNSLDIVRRCSNLHGQGEKRREKEIKNEIENFFLHLHDRVLSETDPASFHFSQIEFFLLKPTTPFKFQTL